MISSAVSGVSSFCNATTCQPRSKSRSYSRLKPTSSTVSGCSGGPSKGSGGVWTKTNGYILLIVLNNFEASIDIDTIETGIPKSTRSRPLTTFADQELTILAWLCGCVCVCGHHLNQTGHVNPACGRLEFSWPLSRFRDWSWDIDSAVSSGGHARLNPVTFPHTIRHGIHQDGYTPWSPSRVYRYRLSSSPRARQHGVRSPQGSPKTEETPWTN